MALNTGEVKYDSKLTAEFLATMDQVKEARTPAAWAAAVYDLLNVPRLATYMPNPPIDCDAWVVQTGSCLGTIELAVDVDKQVLFEEENRFRNNGGVMLSPDTQAELAHTLFTYVYGRKGILYDMLLPVPHGGSDPLYLVLHASKRLDPMLNRYVPYVSVRRALLPV